MKKTKVDIFLETGKAECKHHGLHDQWSYSPVKMKLKNGKKQTYKSVNCLKCAKERTKKWNEKNPGSSNDYVLSFDGIMHRIVNQARSRAKKRNIPFTIDSEWAYSKLKEQNGKCAYSGILFDFSNEKTTKNRLYIPSIDQKTIGVGYTKENSFLVCSVVNLMKNELSLEEFVELSGKIHSYNNKT